MDDNSYAAFDQHGVTDPFGQQAIHRILRSGCCRSAAYYESIDSTNFIALREPVPSSQLPRLVVADQQTAGRGRLGRQWFSDRGTLTFSLRLSAGELRIPVAARSLVALAAGMGVADAAEYYVSPVQPKIKWPNDIYLHDKKIAGLLVEATNERDACVVIGIGINVTTDFSDAPQEIQQRATAIASVSASELSRYGLLPKVVEQVMERVEQLNDDRDQLLTEFRKRCYLTGRTVRVRRPDQTLEGVVNSVTPRGTLLLDTVLGAEEIHAGEIEIVA